MLAAVTSPSPRAGARPLPVRIADLDLAICDECFRPFAKKRIDQRYCSVGNCRRRANQRLEQRRTAAYRAVMKFRDKVKGAFAEMTNLADQWRREDSARADKLRAAAEAAGISPPHQGSAKAANRKRT